MKKNILLEKGQINRHKIVLSALLIISFFLLSIPASTQINTQNMSSVQINNDNSYANENNLFTQSPYSMIDTSSSPDVKLDDIITSLDTSNSFTMDNSTYYEIPIPGSSPVLVDEETYTYLKSLWKFSGLIKDKNQLLNLLLSSGDSNPGISSDNSMLFNLLAGISPQLSGDDHLSANNTLNSGSLSKETTDKLIDSLPDYQNELENSQQYLNSRWNPNITTTPVIPSESSYEDSITNLVLQSGFSNDQSSFETRSITVSQEGNVNLIESDVASENYIISEKTLTTPDISISEKRSILGSGKLVIDQPDMSFLSNISIPVRKSISTEPSTITIEKISKIGFDYSLPGFDWDYKLKLAVVRFHAWASFHASMRWVFPVKFIIQYPSEVIQGQPFSINITLVPLDIENYNEFEFGILLSLGFSIDVIWVEFYLHYTYLYKLKCSWRHGCHWKKDGKIKILGIRKTWKQAYGYGFDFDYFRASSYKTPMKGEKARIDLPLQLDILGLLSGQSPDDNSTSKTKVALSVISVIAKFVKAGIGIDGLDIYGGKVKGKIATVIDNVPVENNYLWTKANQVQSIEISGEKTKDASEISFTISKLQYVIKKISVLLNLFIGPKNFDIWDISVPLGDLIHPFKIPMPNINLPVFSLSSSDVFSISGPHLISSASYNIDMNIKEVTPETGQGTDASISSRDHVYSIEVSNPSKVTDTVLFKATGLPTGYTAKFFPSFVQLDAIGPKQLIMVVYAPDKTDIPPGTINFNVIATSKTMQDYNLPNPSTTKVVQLTIPVFSSFDFELDPEWYDPVMVNYGDSQTIQYSITNTGNTPDTFDVNATLKTTDQNCTWSESLTVNPNEIDSGTFDFVFSREDLFPEPGVYEMDIQATSQQFPQNRKNFILYFNFSKVYDVNSSVSSNEITVGSNFEINFTISITNLGNTIDNFTINFNGRPELIQFISSSPEIINLLPGETKEEEITILITRPLDIPAGDYDLRMTTISEGSSFEQKYSVNDIQIIMPTFDLLPPTVIYDGVYTKGVPLVFTQSSFDLGPTWEAYDQNENYYWVYINDTLYTNSTWTNGTLIQVPVTGSNNLAIGLYNVTIVFSDGQNLATDQKWVQILPPDTTPSIIVGEVAYFGTNNKEDLETSQKWIQILSIGTTDSSNILDAQDVQIPVNFDRTYTLKWTIIEEFVHNMTLLLNNTLVDDSQYNILADSADTKTFYLTIDLHPGELSEGIWNYSLTVVDQGNNSAVSNIQITIVQADYTAPVIDTFPANVAYQDKGNALLFIANDNNPYNYLFYVDSQLMENDTWSSSVTTYFDPDLLGLSLGIHDAELYIYDKAGLVRYYAWYLSINDIDKPTLLNTPISILPEEMASAPNAPVWEVYDRNPGNYSIYRDGVLVENGIWTVANATIRAPINNLELGTYNFQVMIADSTGNTLMDTLDLSIVDIQKPYIMPQDPVFVEPSYGADWFELFIIENHPDTFQLFQNNSLVGSGLISNDFPLVLVDLVGVKPGSYIYTLNVTDQSGNMGSRSVEVKIADFTPPAIIRPPDLTIAENSLGHTLSWKVNELFPESYKIYVDNVLIDSQSYTDSTEPISLSLDELLFGIHQIILVVIDQSGLSYSVLSYVTVIDITSPKISHLSDIIFKSGDSNAQLIWSVTDDHPASYKVFKESSILMENSWSGQNIDIPLVGWAVGTYELRLEVYDVSGNMASDTVTISIVESEPTITNTGSGINISSSPGFEYLITFLLIVGLAVIANKTKRKKY